MRVEELIEELQQLPPELPVRYRASLLASSRGREIYWVVYDDGDREVSIG